MLVYSQNSQFPPTVNTHHLSVLSPVSSSLQASTLRSASPGMLMTPTFDFRLELVASFFVLIRFSWSVRRGNAHAGNAGMHRLLLHGLCVQPNARVIFGMSQSAWSFHSEHLTAKSPLPLAPPAVCLTLPDSENWRFISWNL